MKTELIANVSLAHRLLGWCKEVIGHCRQNPKKFSKFIFMYVLCATIIGIFDYVWIPFLAIRFRYMAFFPLYFSLILVCIIGLGLYQFFKEDLFLKKKLDVTLTKEGKYKFTRWIKGKMVSDSKIAFMVISLENPLQAYIYFRKQDELKLSEAIKLIALGSFYCAFFWGIVIDILVVLWDLGKLLIKLYL